MGHNEKMVSTKMIVLQDQTGRVLDTAEIGMIILSRPVVYLNNGTTYKAMNA